MQRKIVCDFCVSPLPACCTYQFHVIHQLYSAHLFGRHDPNQNACTCVVCWVRVHFRLWTDISSAWTMCDNTGVLGQFWWHLSSDNMGNNKWKFPNVTPESLVIKQIKNSRTHPQILYQMWWNNLEIEMIWFCQSTVSDSGKCDLIIWGLQHSRTQRLLLGTVKSYCLIIQCASRHAQSKGGMLGLRLQGLKLWLITAKNYILNNMKIFISVGTKLFIPK